MIDSHCHLEQHDYDKDRDEVIGRCKQQLDAVVTSCAHPRDFDSTMQLAEKYENFVFASVGLHPEYIKEISGKEIESYMEKIKENRDKISGIGEVGLDFAWVKEPDWQQKQRELFVQFISFAKELKLPLVIHSRDAYEDTIKILEQQDAKKVQMHLFGDNKLVKRVADNCWYVSIGPVILRSKKHFQIARDMPVELLLTETDAPWNAPEVFLEGKKVRNEPTSVKVVAEEFSKIKKLNFADVDKITTENAKRFFNIPV